MMTESPKVGGPDEVCPICKKPKRGHTPEEMLECSRKMKESQDPKEDEDQV